MWKNFQSIMILSMPKGEQNKGTIPAFDSRKHIFTGRFSFCFHKYDLNPAPGSALTARFGCLAASSIIK
jgi:hypothetical protein